MIMASWKFYMAAHGSTSVAFIFKLVIFVLDGKDLSQIPWRHCRALLRPQHTMLPEYRALFFHQIPQQHHTHNTTLFYTAILQIKIESKNISLFTSQIKPNTSIQNLFTFALPSLVSILFFCVSFGKHFTVLNHSFATNLINFIIF